MNTGEISGARNRKAQPLWLQIAETLTKEIANGQHPEGAQLPTEAALAERFDVNRHTVRRALAELADAGLVRTRRGAGSYVSPQQLEHALGRREQFDQTLLTAGKVSGPESAGNRRLYGNARGGAAA